MSKTVQKIANIKSPKRKTGKDKFEVKADEEISIIPEVIFNPATGCVACEEGRQGEGEKNCWGCRLRRLQNIQNILPWNRENIE